MLSGERVGRFFDRSRAEPSRVEKMKVKKLEWHLKVLLPCFRISSVFLVPGLEPLPVFDGLTVFRQRGTKNTGYMNSYGIEPWSGIKP